MLSSVGVSERIFGDSGLGFAHISKASALIGISRLFNFGRFKQACDGAVRCDLNAINDRLRNIGLARRFRFAARKTEVRSGIVFGLHLCFDDGLR